MNYLFIIICKNYKRAKQLYYRFISLADVKDIYKVDARFLEITLAGDGSILKFVSEASGYLSRHSNVREVPLEEDEFESFIETYLEQKRKENGGKDL